MLAKRKVKKLHVGQFLETAKFIWLEAPSRKDHPKIPTLVLVLERDKIPGNTLSSNKLSLIMLIIRSC